MENKNDLVGSSQGSDSQLSAAEYKWLGFFGYAAGQRNNIILKKFNNFF